MLDLDGSLEPEPLESLPQEPDVGMSLQEFFGGDGVQSVASGYGTVPKELPSIEEMLAGLQKASLDISGEQAHMLPHSTDPDREVDQARTANAHEEPDPNTGSGGGITPGFDGLA